MSILNIKWLPACDHTHIGLILDWTWNLSAFSIPKVAWGHHQLVVPGAGLEPAAAQWPGDIKSPAAYPITAFLSIKK